MNQIFSNQHAQLNEILPWQRLSETRLLVPVQKEYVGLSRKTINKLCQLLRTLNYTPQDLYAGLKGIRFLGCYAPKINDALPKIFQELFNKNNGITEFSSDNIFHAVKILAKAISDGNLNEVVISIGMGASVEMPSLRLPSYILPAIKVLKALSEYNLNIGLPIVRVFKATHAGVYANGMDLIQANFITENTLKFLSGFVNKFYPELLNNFVFESDTDYKETTTYSTIIRIAESIKALNGIEKELATLEMMGGKHGGSGGRNNAIFYAAAHPIYNQAIISKSESTSVTKFVTENPRPKLIIDFGGRPQKTFNSIIEALRFSLNGEQFTFPALINLIVKTGKIPVYYKARNGDILLNDLSNSFGDLPIDLLTQGDYDFLFEEVSEYEYFDYVCSFQKQNKI